MPATNLKEVSCEWKSFAEFVNLTIHLISLQEVLFALGTRLNNWAKYYSRNEINKQNNMNDDREKNYDVEKYYKSINDSEVVQDDCHACAWDMAYAT